MTTKNLLSIILILLITTTVSYGQEQKKEEKVLTYSNFKTAKLGDYDKYISKDGIEFKVGDHIKMGIPMSGSGTQYVFIRDTNRELVSIEYNGQECEIITIGPLGNPFKKTRDKVGFLIKTISSYKSKFWIEDVEKALENGEVKPVGALTSDEAIEQLKKAKDKLDLGLITQSKYDSLKTALSKFIK